MPRTRAVERVEYLVELARGRSVIHVGFAGGSEGPDAQGERGPWLHGELARVASRIVGIDLSADGVERAHAAGFEGHVADCGDPDAVRGLGLDPAEIVIAGEVIEHVETPGAFLDGVRALCRDDGRLAITTPNAASMLNPLAAIARRELVNPTHVAIYSWYTLGYLLARHGWSVEDFVPYHLPLPERAAGRSAAEHAARALAFVQRGLSRLWPFVDFGLIAVASPTPPTAAAS